MTARLSGTATAYHEYRTVRVLQYEPPQGIGDDLSRACEAIEADGWSVITVGVVGASEHYGTTSFVVVARKPKAGE